MNSQKIDLALKQLEEMHIVPCGAIHESGKATFDASDCPIRVAGNLACCHPEYGNSAVRHLWDSVQLTRQLESEAGHELLPAGIDERISNAHTALYRLDVNASEDYSDLPHEEARARIVPLQIEQGEKLMTAKQEIETALRSLKEKC